MHIDFVSTLPAIVSTGCLTRAAELLDVSPSTIYKRLKKVEEYYSIVIFKKVSGKLVLTCKGRDLIDGLYKINEINNKLLKENNLNHNEVHIGINQGLAIRLVREVISEYIKYNPNIKIRISTVMDLNTIENFIGDFVITTAPINDVKFSKHVIDEMKSYFVASTQYLTEFGEPQSISELSQHNLILTPIECYDECYFYCENIDGEKCQFDLNSKIFADSKIVSNEFIANHNGIGLVPHRTLATNRPDNFKVLLNGTYLSKSFVNLCTVQNQIMSDAAKGVMDKIVEKFNYNYQ